MVNEKDKDSSFESSSYLNHMHMSIVHSPQEQEEDTTITDQSNSNKRTLYNSKRSNALFSWSVPFHNTNNVTGSSVSVASVSSISSYSGISIQSNSFGNSSNLDDCNVVVGYAFGPKKMSTMGIIMAEASKAVRYLHVLPPSATNAACSTYDVNICLQKRRLCHVTQSNSKASTASGVTTYSDNSLLALKGDHQDRSTSSLSGIVSLSTVHRPHQRNINVSFVPIDLDYAVEDQHGGKFDVILHKLTEDILSVLEDTKEGGDRKSSAAVERLNRLEKYQEDHKESCTLLDDPSRIRSLLSREQIAGILSECLKEITTKSGVPVRAPRFHIFDGSVSKSTDSTSIKNLRFPLIAKPLAAAGTVESHKMMIVTKYEGLKDVQMACILQEYSNHDAILFKVYVIGNDVFVYERPSLPNLPTSSRDYGTSERGMQGETIWLSSCVEFDSQKPYPKLSDICNVGVVGDDNLSAESVIKRRKLHHNCTIAIDETEIRPVAQALRSAFGLDLFGFDILVSKNLDSGVEVLVVDVNYFPSYKEVPNFPALLAKYLTQRAIDNRSRSWHFR